MQDDIRVSRGASTEVQRDVSQNLWISADIRSPNPETLAVFTPWPPHQ